MREGDILENRYQIIREIGEGGTGVIYLAYHLTLMKYIVIKKVKDNFIGRINVRGEVDILKRLHHTYLPQVFDFVQIGTTIYTVMDYIEGVDMQHCIDCGMYFSEEQLTRWMKQICEVLEYLHSQKSPIYHSDIKPGNIMITPQGNICLIDFNISLEGSDMDNILGISQWFAAPEQYEKALVVTGQVPYKKIELDGRMDLYSAAATFYKLMTGILPSPMGNTPLLSYDIPYSSGFRAILDKAMSVTPSGRYPSAHSMLKALDSVEKMDPKYRRISGIQWATGAIYAIVGVICVLMIYYGVFLNQREAYREAWQSFYDVVAKEEDSDIIAQGIELLNKHKYKKHMQDDERREILYAIGTSFYNQEDYMNAVYYFEEAAIGSKNADYYIDYAIALARNGQSYKAEIVLSDAEFYTLNSAQMGLVKAEVFKANGKYDEALENLDFVLSESNDKDMLVHAGMVKADIYGILGDIDMQVQSIKDIIEYDSGAYILRKYGAILCEAAEQSASESVSQEYYSMALDCYKKLSNRPYASFEDRMNLAIVELSLGMTKECRSDLENLILGNEDDYRIYMLICESYLLDGVRINQATNDGNQLRMYFEKAKEAYKGSPNDETMNELLHLFGE